MAIERKNLRSQVRDELLERMRSGAVAPGEGINEVQLATELGVSRTPLREALIALESEGQITSENGKGFRFAPFSVQEFQDLAPVMAALESLALELTPAEALPALGEKLAALAAEFDADVAEHGLIIKNDDQWHEVMLSACPNRPLLNVIESVRASIHRYESLLVPEGELVGRVASEHADIARHLVAGDIVQATAALRTNWMNGNRRIADNASSPYFTA